MKIRRSFFVFILLRYLAWGTATAVIVGFLIGVGFFDGVPVAQLVGLGIVGIVASFFEYDSLPRKIQVGERALVLIDPSGEKVVSSEFGVRQFLWLTRVVICRNRKVHFIPLEAYQSTSELTKIARRRKPGHAKRSR